MKYAKKPAKSANSARQLPATRKPVPAMQRGLDRG